MMFAMTDETPEQTSCVSDSSVCVFGFAGINAFERCAGASRIIDTYVSITTTYDLSYLCCSL
jgi:hypothetical protein